jgi:SAM-dependent methyltransferase
MTEGAMKRYVLGNDAVVEYERLDLMSKILDPWTRRYLTALGIDRGWRCLEVGGGNGSVTEWLCERVGPEGAVTSLDLDTRLIRLVPARNLVVWETDVRTTDLSANAYDLVMCRATLHQIASFAPVVLAKMAGAVKDGGWLFVQEPDFNLVRTTEPELWAKTWEGLIEWGRTQDVDWLIGRRLPAMVTALGLGLPEAATDVEHIRGTERGALYFQLFFEIVRERVVASGHVDAALLEAAHRLLDDPNYWTQCWMMTAVWVRKPTAGETGRAGAPPGR